MPGFNRSVTGTVGTATQCREVKVTTGDKTQTIQIKTTDPEIGWVKLRIDDPKQFFDSEGKDVFSPKYADVATLLGEIDGRLGGH
jgi:hypothetical protein